MMRRATAMLALLLAAAASLVGCGSLDAFPTAPQPAKVGKPAPLPRVAICYNGLASSRAEAQAQAQLQCAKGTLAEPVATDYWLQYCPLLLPARATFACATPTGK
jgi:hypothetical protein